MGVPLTNYTVLKYLADGADKAKVGLRSDTMEYALNALEGYSVFAFILHDPKIHTDFHEFFQKQFKSLHNSTGEHLVFFGLVDSPKNYRLTGRTPFYQDVREGVELYEEEHGLNDNYSFNAFALATSLNIEPEMLPAIVITHDTRLSSYRWYKTCPDMIETQMGRLTGISYEMNDYKKDADLPLHKKQEILYHFLDENDLDLCKGMGTTLLNESMARALSDLMSYLIDEEQDRYTDFNQKQILRMASSQKRMSLNNALRSLGNLKLSLKDVDISDIESHALFPLIDELSTKLAIKMSLLEKKSRHKLNDNLSIKEDWLEQHSYHLLKTGLEVESFLLYNSITKDFSASAICLAKMFEKEINYSIVHAIRKQYSVELPRFFNQYQPGVAAKVKVQNQYSSREFIVDFNKSNNGRWQPPELGISKAIANNNLTLEQWRLLGLNNSEDFLTSWDKIHQIRNKAAHTQSVTNQELNEMKASISNLASNNIFTILAKLKDKYRNPNLNL
jgi:hypothetical protein